MDVQASSSCYVGGLFGYLGTSGYEIYYYMYYCKSRGRIEVGASGECSIGGQVGYIYGGNKFYNCDNLLHIKATPSKACRIRGIIGYTSDLGISDYLYNCCTAGSIDCDSQSAEEIQIGGIIGNSHHYLGNSSLYECCNTADIVLNENSIAPPSGSSAYRMVGGLAGYLSTIVLANTVLSLEIVLELSIL